MEKFDNSSIKWLMFMIGSSNSIVIADSNDVNDDDFFFFVFFCNLWSLNP